jgi:hypothetical protein
MGRLASVCDVMASKATFEEAMSAVGGATLLAKSAVSAILNAMNMKERQALQTHNYPLRSTENGDKEVVDLKPLVTWVKDQRGLQQNWRIEGEEAALSNSLNNIETYQERGDMNEAKTKDRREPQRGGSGERKDKIAGERYGKDKN